jgi:superoxide reductase
MKNRWFFLFSVVFLASALILLSTGCGKKAEKTEEPAVQKEAPMAAEESTMEKPYTKDNPGPWAALVDVHLPQITYEKTDTGLKVTVKVDNHPMDAQKPHYIMWIKLEDGSGTMLGEKDFMATDPEPVATFDLTSVPVSLKAYEQCNIHGIWMSEANVDVQ